MKQHKLPSVFLLPQMGNKDALAYIPPYYLPVFHLDKQVSMKMGTTFSFSFFFLIFSTLCQLLRCPAMQISCTQRLNSQMSALPSFLSCTSLQPFRRKQNFLYKKSPAVLFLLCTQSFSAQCPSKYPPIKESPCFCQTTRGVAILNSHLKHHAFCGEVKLRLLLFLARTGQILWDSSDQPLSSSVLATAHISTT